MSKRNAIGVFVASTALLAVHLSCGGGKGSSTKKPINPNAIKATPGKLKKADTKGKKGLHIELSDGTHKLGKPARVKSANVSALSHGAAQNLLARLPGIKSTSNDTKSFHLRGKSLPPPRTGRTIKTPFPAVGSGGPPPVKVQKGALKVSRFAPEGKVPLAPHLSVTFSQPMIAVSSHANTVAKGVPVKLTPEPKGTWRWIGTRTLLFDPDVRFPQATAYKVEIPAGTKSANGGVLARAKRWTFTTPAPRMKASHPRYGPHPLNPVMFVSFDQRIDPAKVINQIQVRAKSQTFKVRLATAAEIKADKAVARMVAAANKSHHKARYLAFRTLKDLPKEASVTVKVSAGTPSAEGPLVTKRDQSYSFRTYAPLRVVRYRCGWGGNCPPGQQWHVRFNNPLDHEAFDSASLAISPDLPRYRSHVSHSYLYIRGKSKARTSYTLTLPATLTDKFGQTLGTEKDLTFQVGSARPFLRGKQGLTVADPAAAKPVYSTFTVNIDKLDVKVWKVSPSDWWAYTKYMRNRWRRIGPKKPPGTLVVNKTIETKGKADDLTETNIDLGPALAGKFGHAIIRIEPTTWPRKHKPSLQAWVQVTKLGLDAFADDTELIGWATKLADGSPLSGVKLRISPIGGNDATDGKGLARIALGKRPNRKSTPHNSTAQMLLATRGNDVAFLPEHSYYWSSHGSWYRRDRSEQLRWFTFDDRKMYKPGEKVSIKGWLRRIDFGEGGDTGALNGAVSKVSYTVRGAQGNQIAKGSATVNAAGGFDTKFKLPKNANLGHAYVRFSATSKGLSGTSHSHGFKIQEFRRPEYEVTVKAGQGPYLVGTSTDVTVKAKYYAGGGLANAKVNWYVRASTGTFRPPNRKDFVFGEWVPWWRRHSGGNHTSFSRTGKTDATGSHVLNMDFVSVNPPRPMNVQIRGSVRDVNRQSWTGRTNLLVHPSDYYVGLKGERMFVEQGEPIEVKAIVVDHDGKAIVGRKVSMQAVRMEWVYEKGEYKNKQKDPQDCSLTSAAKAKVCAFPTKEGGVYYVTASVSDAKGRMNETKITAWVSGGKIVPARNVSRQKVELIPNKKDYKPGETAKVLVRAPFFPAEGLMSIRRSGIVSTKRFKLTSSTTTLSIPVREAYLPNAFVQVDLVGAAERTNDKGKADPTLPRRPAFASGSIKLSVPPKGRSLKVDIKPAVKKLAPGGKTHLDIRVTDANGAAISGAEVAVVVVDESILSLTGYRLPNALSAFYPARGAGARDRHMRGHVTLANPESTRQSRTRGRNGGGGIKADEEAGDDKNTDGAPPPPPSPVTATATNKPARVMAPKKKAPGKSSGGNNQAIAVRIDFRALALFAPEVGTDGNGRARVAIKLPDSLTRYRIMAVAVDTGKRFGNGESSITARKPLMIRPSPPRFLNFGDRFELPIVLQNQTDDDMTVKVAARATNARLTKDIGQSLTVPANDRVEIRFPAAAQMPGTARFQIAASSGSFSDAAEFSLPVWTPATTEAFATYGVLTRGAMRQPVAMPKNVVKEFGGLEITTSSTQLQALTDAVLYLVQYPFECTEQMSSRVLAISSLRDVLSAFKAKGLPSADKIEASVRRDIKMISRLQNYDGGFAFWRRGDRSWPYVSTFVAHGLITAKNKGYKVPQHTLNRSKRYLRDIRTHIPSWYPLRVKRTLRAYALYVRMLMKDKDISKAKALIREAKLKNLAMDAIGWLYAVLAKDKTSGGQLRAIRRYLGNRVSETAAAANFTTSYSDGAHLLLHSSRRADAIILDAMIKDRPKSKLIPKLVRGLLAHRKRGRWGNTQENSFVLLALDRYFNVFEKVTPNFVARIWLGKQFAGEHKYKGRSTDRKHIDVPMSYIAKVKNADLVMSKKGKGRLYYRVGMSYAPTSLKLGPADHGFAVNRVYEAVDSPGDVSRRGDGTWLIKAGARVRVRLTMVAVNRRYHVALVDKLPAGLETLNPSLAVTGAIPQDPKTKKRGRYWWWSRTWYEHQNMRDERTEAFTSLLWQGVHKYTYVTRATTPGNFVVPPAKAEEMYHPETFGRSASDRVIIR